MYDTPEEIKQATLEELQINMLDDSRVIKNDIRNQVPQELLSKYILYAKKMVHPKLNEIDREKVT